MESLFTVLREPPAVTDEQFRAAGYSADARKYPLTPLAMQAKCAFNGVTMDQAPDAWWYAPNPIMQQYWEVAALSPPPQNRPD